MTSAELQSKEALAEPLQWKPVALLTASHSFIDLCQGMVPALIPFLIVDLNMSYEAGGGLGFAISASSSIIQPLFGHLADRSAFRWLLPLSVLVTGAGLAIGSQSSNYPVFFILLIVSGLGVAAFHPEAARQIHRLAGSGRSSEMSVFAFGGGLGFALAPLATAALVKILGRHGTLLILLPTVFLAVALAARFSLRMPVSNAVEKSRSPAPPMPDGWAGFAVLSLVTVCRSIVFSGLNYFLALFWMSRWHWKPEEGVTVLGLFLGVGLCGTLLGGWLADRWGRRPALRAGFGIAAVLLPLVLVTPDSRLALLLLVPLALTFFVPSSLLVLLGQEYLPRRIGVASGVTLGLGVSMGGMAIPVLGKVADVHGIEVVMQGIEIVLILAVLLSLALPWAPGLMRSKGPQSEASEECR